MTDIVERLVEMAQSHNEKQAEELECLLLEAAHVIMGLRTPVLNDELPYSSE
jgi:hypothetical protein